MKSSAAVFSWLAVPLAATAGFYGGHQRQDRALSATPGEPGKKTPVLRERAEAPLPASPPAAASVITKWADRLRHARLEELPALYDEIHTLGEKAMEAWKMAAASPGKRNRREQNRDFEEQRGALCLLCARWAELDAPGGMAFFARLKSEKKDENTLSLLLKEWALLNPTAAFEAIRALPAAEAEAELRGVGYGLLEEGKEEFWAWFQLARLPLPSGYGGGEIWQSLAQEHFDELAAIAAELAAAPKEKEEGVSMRTQELEQLFKLLASTLAAKDPDKAIAWAKEQPESVRGKALTGALEVLAQKSPEKVADYLSLLKSKQVGANAFLGSGGDQILKTAVETMAANNPLNALQWLADNQPKLPEDINGFQVMREQLAKAMKEGRLTAEEAFTAVRGLKNEMLRLNLAGDMWRGLPASQLAVAAEWLKGVDSKQTKQWAMAGIFPEWAAQDRPAAMKFASEIKDPELATSLYSGLAREAESGLVSTQAERITAAFNSIPPEYRAAIVQDQVRMHYGEGMMDYSPPFDGTGVSKALEGLPPSEATDKAVIKVAEVWGASDPAAAMSWATGQTDAGLREKATGAAVEAWAKEDAWGASQWIDSQPQGETRDIASHHLARILRTDEPESAWTWAGSISDPGIRLEAQSAVLRKWRDSSAAEARSAVEDLGADLPAADRQKLVDTLEHRDAAK